MINFVVSAVPAAVLTPYAHRISTCNGCKIMLKPSGDVTAGVLVGRILTILNYCIQWLITSTKVGCYYSSMSSSRTWMSDHIPLFHADISTCPCGNFSYSSVMTDMPKLATSHFQADIHSKEFRWQFHIRYTRGTIVAIVWECRRCIIRNTIDSW